MKVKWLFFDIGSTLIDESAEAVQLHKRFHGAIYKEIWKRGGIL